MTQPAHNPQRPKVVVVDDDKKLLEMLKEALSDRYEVSVAAQAQEGLALVENVDPEVVILDIDLPGMDGFAFCEALREAGWVRHIPVIFITGHSGEAFEADAKRAGGDAFITKPFNFEQLVATIEKLRTKPHAKPAPKRS